MWWFSHIFPTLDASRWDIHGHPTLESEILTMVFDVLWTWFFFWDFLEMIIHDFPWFSMFDFSWGFQIPSVFRCQVPIGPLAQHTRFDGGAGAGRVSASRFGGGTDVTDVTDWPNIWCRTPTSKHIKTLVKHNQNMFSNMKFTMKNHEKPWFTLKFTG